MRTLSLKGFGATHTKASEPGVGLMWKGRSRACDFGSQRGQGLVVIGVTGRYDLARGRKPD